MGWLWRELTRPRGHEAHRFYRGGRGSKGGVALLLVLTNLLLMSVLVSEMTFTASVRVKLAVHQRDEAKAEQLAYTGAQLYQLFLLAQKGISRMPQIQQAAQMFGIDVNNLWQALPMINTGLMRMVFVSNGSIDEEDMERAGTEGLSEEEVEESREEGSGSDRNFLDFDGDFAAEITDENSKVNVSMIGGQNLSELLANPQAQQLYGLMAGEDNDRFFLDRNLERWELIGNLADWVDADTTRAYQGGPEDALYNNLDSPYLPKNASFNSFDEIRLVDGWHRDDVWERFGQHLTVYGSGRINVNSAQPEVIRGLLVHGCNATMPAQQDPVMAAIEERRLLIGPFMRPRDFIQTVTGTGLECPNLTNTMISTQSDIFRITSTGVVGEAKATITTIIDQSSNRGPGKVVHFKIQ
ncbi:MAG: general secretion pathway protein GspK [Proteobacteria bacterium]|nr:general secretion pathway protein GspK [Pseudomonadota bacterium]